MPNLQEHQLRVAAVAQQICDSLQITVDTQTVVTACLLHDMGNIIKFDLGQFPKFLEPEGRDYWEGVKADFIKHYGPSEHEASMAIARELGVSGEILDCIESIDFGEAIVNAKSFKLEPKICDNADLRVGPHGVVSIDERLEEGRKRYIDRPEKWIQPEQWQELDEACHNLEDQVFEKSTIRPQDITDKSIQPIMKQLRAYQI
jgi:putative nucleotidyltransferase with HDIG domain